MMRERLAIIGCGAIAGAHAEAVQRLSARCELVALCDVDEVRTAAFALRFAPQAARFTDVEALLRESAPDAVLLCTTPVSHAALGVACLRRGVAVLCEKPLCTTSEAAHSLVELAAQRDVVLRTSAKFRFVPGVQIARKCIESGDLGTLRRIEISFGAATPLVGCWHRDAGQSGGGVLMDNGPHAIDLARFLGGEVRLQSTELSYGTEHRVEEEARLGGESTAGVPVSIALSWRRGWGEIFLAVTGERGSVRVGWNATVRQSESGTEHIIAPGYAKADAFTRQLDAFLDDVARQSGATLPSRGVEVWKSEDGARAVDVITAAYNAEGKRHR